MEVHKPRGPIHGWREFLKEVGIIVLGVLIALTAEQTVATLHSRRASQEANQRVREEIARSLAYAEERVAISACVDTRLAQIRKVLIAAAGGPLPILPALDHPPGRPFINREWNSAVALGLHDRFSRAEKAIYPGYEDAAGYMAELTNREIDEWERLSTLVGYSRRLDDRTREELLQVTALSQGTNRKATQVSQQLVQMATSVGITPIQKDPDGSSTTDIPEERARLCAAWPEAR